MKKLITILTIMIVLVGAVFATDPTEGTAAINITASITEQFPTFKLNTKAGEAAIGSAAENAVSTAAHEAGTTALTADSVQALSVNGTDVSVKFQITQTADARLNANSSKHVYTFGVSATSLILQINSADKENYGATERFMVVDATPAINAKDSANAEGTITVADDNTQDHAQANIETASIAGGDGTMTVTYAGFVPSGTVLGNFEVGWHGNAAAAPGSYKATIRLSVTAE